MRSVVLLYILVLLISEIITEELKNNKIEENGVKYMGPIIYSNEPPPVVYFPTPPTTNSKEKQSIRPNITSSNHVEYVPFPYQELPILIYKSKENPPIHVVPDGSQTNSLNNDNQNDTQFDKRFGEIADRGTQRASRALKSWSQFKLFNDMPLVMKAPKWTNSDNNGANLMTGQIVDMNNSSLISSGNHQISLANAPHVVYSGHPPIHVFPQPIIIKEPTLLNSEMGEMSSASEQFHSIAQNFKTPNNLGLTSVAASNKHEISANPDSSSIYSYGTSPSGSSSTKSYGFRVNTRGNKFDTDYSSSRNYENYDDIYGQQSQPQHSDGSSESQTEDNIGYGKSTFSEPINNNEEYDRDQRVRYPDSYNREKMRDKYPKYNTNNFGEWDQENGWLSSLLGYTRSPSRQRRPFGMSVANTISPDNYPYVSSPSNNIDFESLALMNPQIRNNGWLAGFGGLRPAASAIRPVYGLSSLFGYRRPPIPPPSPYFGRFSPGLAHAGSSLSPMALKPYGFGPSMMGLQSLTYPMRIPYSPYLMYGYRRPLMGYGSGHASGDLAFAESNRKTNTNVTKVNMEDMQMSASHVKPTFVLPADKQTQQTQQTHPSHKNKPPIIIYQGLRPPVHLYQQPSDPKSKSNYDNEKVSMNAFQEMQDIKNRIQEQTITSTTTTTTESPYYKFYSTEGSKVNFDEKTNRYKSGLDFYASQGSAFSPRLNSNEEWTPVRKTNSESNTYLKKSDSDYQI